MQTDSIAVILLAAGASVRLGEPKQLLQFQGETLLRRSAKTALAVSNQVVITLGANIEITRKEIEDLPIQTAENKNWETGMSGSIRSGLEKLLAEVKEPEAVILMVCDQPFADEKLLKEIISAYKETNSLIVACEYENTLGVPALFQKNLFPELLALDSQGGAKQLIKKYRPETATISFSKGAFDVDTPTDYQNLIASRFSLLKIFIFGA
jgi:molybdenum cofactor cytidylyltransferase